MFQLCDAFVENCRRRIGQTRIDVARTLQSEFGSCILCVLEDVGSCLINRRRAGPRFVDDLTCVNLQRFKFVILIAHKRDPLYFFRDVESDKQQIKNAPVKEHLSQGRILAWYHPSSLHHIRSLLRHRHAWDYIVSSRTLSFHSQLNSELIFSLSDPPSFISQRLSLESESAYSSRQRFVLYY